MKRSPATRMVEDYVTLIWKAHEWPGGEPSTTDLASIVHGGVRDACGR